MKKGSSILSVPIALSICIVAIVTVGVQIINYIIPFVYYQKLENIATKYMFVVEKFGYLTTDEKKTLEDELKNEGFDLSKMKIVYPNKKESYGSLISLELTYTYTLKINEFLTHNLKETAISVKKNSFSKVY